MRWGRLVGGGVVLLGVGAAATRSTADLALASRLTAAPSGVAAPGPDERASVLSSAAGAPGGDADDDDAPHDLRRPPVPAPVPFDVASPAASDRWAYAFHFNGPIYDAARPGADILGYVRRNRRVPVARYVAGEGCPDGGWYEVFDVGFVCSSDGFVVDTEAEVLPPELRITPARLDTHLPYRYAKVGLETRRWASIPAVGAEDDDGSVPGGVHFVAVDDVVEDHGGRFVRTLRGLYHRESDVTWLPPSTMSGVTLGEDLALPVAFVIDDDVPLYEPGDEMLARVGSAERFARFHVATRTEVADRALVVSPEGLAAPAEHVRIAHEVARPEDIPADAKWIHVDRATQTLVAYEGDTPVRATLVSTGKEGYEPPRGVFRIHKRFVSRTMSGPDDVHGTYEVEQVPWTMYYWGSLAIHGAYWHDEFGRVRSHGCTNVPPADARWLFFWSGPDLPPAWHGTIGRRGAYVYTT